MLSYDFLKIKKWNLFDKIKDLLNIFLFKKVTKKMI